MSKRRYLEYFEPNGSDNSVPDTTFKVCKFTKSFKTGFHLFKSFFILLLQRIYNITVENNVSDCLSSHDIDNVTLNDVANDRSQVENCLQYLITSSPISSLLESDIESECDSDAESIFESLSSENNEHEFPQFENIFEHHKTKFFENSPKIHQNLACTQSEALMMVLMYYLKHNLSWLVSDFLYQLFYEIYNEDYIPLFSYSRNNLEKVFKYNNSIF